MRTKLETSPALTIIFISWAYLIAAQFIGITDAAGHHALLETYGLSIVSVTIFLLFWGIMVLAMMVPLNRVLVDTIFGNLAHSLANLRAGTSFVGGYTVSWLLFGAFVFVTDAGLHMLTHSVSFLQAHQWLVLMALLAGVGGYQFLPLKRQSVRACHQEATRIAAQGSNPAGRFGQGLRYGKREIVCCGNLMLLAAALGHGLVSMAFMTGVMLAEKILPPNLHAARYIGSFLLVLALFAPVLPL